MRIHNINPYSFKGINITKKEKASENDYSSVINQYEREDIIRRWQEEHEFLSKCYAGVKVGDVDALSKKVMDRNSGFTPKDLVAKRKEISVQDALLKEQGMFADRMIQIANNAEKALLLNDKKQFSLPLDFSHVKYSTIPQREGISKIAGYDKEIAVLENEYISKIKREKAGEDIDIFGSILFFGPHGNGKTYITKAVAEATNSNIVKIHSSSASNSQIEKTMKKIISVAEKAEEKFKEDRTRTIIFVDEVDKIISKGSPIIDEFSSFIETCSEKYHCSVFAATNNPLNLGVNYENPDIFPVKMSIDFPDEKSTKALLEFYLKDRAAQDVNIEKIMALMKERENETNAKYTNGQIRNLAFGIVAIEEGKMITQADIEERIKMIPPEMSAASVAKFDNDYKQMIEREW